MSFPLIELVDIGREFTVGQQKSTVLKAVNLTIYAGELIAIMGTSGSGKSTLMNILGCLDRPTHGQYRINGKEQSAFNVDELAELRRDYFGFIFQRYHLLTHLNALDNVALPAVYANRLLAERRARAYELLQQLGLAKHAHHFPNQLSGGQQQRVSIGRALMNGGKIILADEPTGALDTHSGNEVMQILKRLHSEGHTIILVTHDSRIAAHAQRIVRISDGEILSDKTNLLQHIDQTTEVTAAEAIYINHATSHEQHSIDASKELISNSVPPTAKPAWQLLNIFSLTRSVEAFQMAIVAMRAHRLRTLLTMLGIIIGIAAVVSVVALGNGSREKILDDIRDLGTNALHIFPGSGFGDEKAEKIRTLNLADIDAIAEQPYIHSVTPLLQTRGNLRVNDMDRSSNIFGVGEQYFQVYGYQLAKGQLFDRNSIANSAQTAVINEITQSTLFDNSADPIGQIILINQTPVRIIGVVKNQYNPNSSEKDLSVWLPYSAMTNRLTGHQDLRMVTARINDDISMEVAEQALSQLLTVRHGTKDFFIFNTNSIRKTVEKTTAMLTIIVSSIALIALVVGGIGVMNIMLISISERTREIGIRVAVGAYGSDIRRQFLIEAVLVCFIGGIIGIILALVVGLIIDNVNSIDGFRMRYSLLSMIVAFVCSTFIGIIFGYLPARNAARLDPIEALARE